jgi:hypothetical protein
LFLTFLHFSNKKEWADKSSDWIAEISQVGSENAHGSTVGTGVGNCVGIEVGDGLGSEVGTDVWIGVGGGVA